MSLHLLPPSAHFKTEAAAGTQHPSPHPSSTSRTRRAPTRAPRKAKWPPPSHTGLTAAVVQESRAITRACPLHAHVRLGRTRWGRLRTQRTHEATPSSRDRAGTRKTAACGARLCGELLRWVVIWTCISDLLGYKMTITVPFCSRKSVVYICRKYSNVLTDPGQIWQGEAARLGENGPGVGGTCPRHWPPEQAPVVTHWLLHPELMG